MKCRQMLVAVSVSHGAKFEGGNNWGKYIFVLPNEMNDSLMFNTNIYFFLIHVYVLGLNLARR